jgi:predicted phage terminase large subunit-like protein
MPSSTRSTRSSARPPAPPPPSLAEVDRPRLSRSLPRFIRAAWPIIEPSTEFLEGWHIDLVAEYLEAVTAGEVSRLIVNHPPRYMKSINVSVMWPAWSWTRRPELRFMFSSYSQSLATKHSLDRRAILTSEWYRERWGDRFTLASDQNVKTEFVNDRRGHMIATSFKGTATGKGGDVLVIDDPLDPEQAHSDVERERVNRTFDLKFSTRLDDKRTGAIVLVMQRLHEDDLTGHLLAQGGWEHVCLPGIAEHDERHLFPRSAREVIRLPGEALWPEKEPLEVVRSMQVRMGSYGFSGQYQQRPTPAEGGILKRYWWRFFPVEWLEHWQGPPLGALVSSWDTALKEKTSSDFTVGTLWGISGANRYLLRRFRERVAFPDTKAAIAEQARWASRHFAGVPQQIVIELAANGPELVAALRQELPGVIGIAVDRDKTSRAHAVSAQLEAGNVFCPGASAGEGGYDATLTPIWVQELIEECAAFPNALHNDQVDSVTQALLRAGRVLTVSGREGEHAERGAAISAGILERTF